MVRVLARRDCVTASAPLKVVRPFARLFLDILDLKEQQFGLSDDELKINQKKYSVLMILNKSSATAG